MRRGANQHLPASKNPGRMSAPLTLSRKHNHYILPEMNSSKNYQFEEMRSTLLPGVSLV